MTNRPDSVVFPILRRSGIRLSGSGITACISNGARKCAKDIDRPGDGTRVRRERRRGRVKRERRRYDDDDDDAVNRGGSRRLSIRAGFRHGWQRQRRRRRRRCSGTGSSKRVDGRGGWTQRDLAEIHLRGGELADARATPQKSPAGERANAANRAALSLLPVGGGRGEKSRGGWNKSSWEMAVAADIATAKPPRRVSEICDALRLPNFAKILRAKAQLKFFPQILYRCKYVHVNSFIL